MTVRRDRAGDAIRARAYRLALAERLGAAEIEARLIGEGLVEVPEALEGIRNILDMVARGRRPKRIGIAAMFTDD